MRSRILPWLGIAVIAVSGVAHAQTIHKCVGKDGKTAYSNEPCPGSKEIQAAPPSAVKGADAKKGPSGSTAAAGASNIPEMQAGKWRSRMSGGRERDSEMCGNPIDGFSREVREYAASTQWGCTMTSNATGPRSATVVYDCPSDRSPDGRPVQKGKWEISVASPSPQAFRIEMKSTADRGYVMEGTRIGDCP